MSRLVRTLRLVSLAALATGLVLGLTVGAYAYLTAGGSGRGAASIAALPAPTITRATAGSASVALEWSAVTAPGSGTVSYYVTRDGGDAVADCGTQASPRAVTSCRDTGLSLARHTYTVTAVWRSWSGRSASSSVTVTNGPAVELAFTTQPSSSTGGVAFPTQPVVVARDAGRNVVADYSGTVALSILRGGAGGAALSGCTGTLVNGVTTFSGCKIDRSSGSQYFLRARDGTLSVDSSGFTVSTGTLAQFFFTTQPGNGTGGTQLSTQPVVTAADAGGNTVTGGSSPTLSIVPGTGAAGAVLSQCDASTRSGVTTYDNCEIDRAGTGYRLRATSGAVTGDSNAFNVTVGLIDDIVFTTQPGGSATGGIAFPTQPVVTGVDDGGNTVASYASVPAITVVSGETISGCRGVNAGGVVTYGGCAIDRAGSFRLRADDGPRDDTSGSFTVSVGPLARLAFTAQPTTVTAGSTFGTSPIVVGADAGGNTVAGYTGTVTLTVARDPSVLTGCSGSLRSGATTFTGCRLGRSGSGWVLHASDGTLTGDSPSITVSAGSATQLAFTTQPAGATANASFATQPVVSALDALGNVATSYTGTVQLSIVSGTGTRGATLSSCSGSRVNGVTTFSSCRIDRLGVGYRLRAADSRGAVTSVDSAAFDVVAGRAAGFLLQATSTGLTAGVATDLTITARDAGGNVDTTYTGVKSLRFGGSGSSPSGTAPTATNNGGTAIAFGSTTTIEFVNGVARASGGANGAMVLRDAGSGSITVDEASFDEEDQLDVTVAAGAPARLAWTDVDESDGTLSSPCLFVCTNSNVNSGSTFNANVSVTDADGNTVSNIGSGHTVRVAVVSGGSFTSPSSGSSVTLSFPNTGIADSTAEFTYRTQTSGSWATNTFRVDTLAGTVYTSAAATMVN